MIKPPPTAGSPRELKLWASDVFRQTSVSRDDVRAIADIETAVNESPSEWAKGLAEAVLLFVRVLQGDIWSAPNKVEGGRDADLLKLLVSRADEGRRPSELAALLGISREHVSRRLGRLVEQDLARRQPSTSGDRRSVLYTATPEGMSALKMVADSPELGDIRRFEQLALDHKRHTAVQLILSQRDDRRAEKHDGARFVERALMAAEMARELQDTTLYLDALNEYLTSLRHRDNVADHETIKQRISELHKPLDSDESQEDGCYREAVRTYQLAKLSGPELACYSELLAAADQALAGAGNHRGAELGVWIASALATLSMSEGRPGSAAHQARQAQDLASEQDDWFAEVTVGSRYAMILRRTGNARTAASVLIRLQRRMEEAGAGPEYDRLRAECHYQLGEVRRYQGRPDEAYKSLVRASELLHSSDTRERTRLFSFTQSALAASIFDLKNSKHGPIAEGRDPITILEDMLEASPHRSADVEALTKRRLSVALLRNNRQSAYALACSAVEMYEGVSLVGQIESLICAAQASRAPRNELTRVPDLIMTVIKHMDGQRTGDSQLILFDSWVRRALRGLCRRIDEQPCTQAVDDALNELSQAQLIARPSADNGASMMGKEPVQLAA